MMSPAYQFGEFRLEPASRQLWRGDEEVALHRRAFNCIVYLLGHRDRAVTRDELVSAVWGDVYLSDGARGQAIFRARRALDDTGQEQRLIRTMWGYGYRWVAPVDIAGTTQTWTLHIGESFDDVPTTGAFYPAIETLLHSGITGGCSATDYCPGDPVTRGQMAVFVTRTFGLTLYGP